MTDCKTITAREIKQIAATFEEKEKYIMWHGKRIKVTPLLSFKDMFDLVKSILHSCSSSEKQTLFAESVDFVFKIKMIEKYGGIILPEDINEQYKIIYGSDIVQIIFNSINQSQLIAIARAITAYTGVALL